jgi:tetratricopeptide (TPR) repeat protein
MGALYAMEGKGEDVDSNTKQQMREKAKSSFKKAVQFRPGLGSAWVNLALLMLAEGKETSGDDAYAVEHALKEARSCCERALGIDNDDERSRSLANKLIYDIDALMKQNNIQKPFQ